MLVLLGVRLFLVLRSVTDRAADEDGQTIAEYGLIMAFLAVSVIALAIIGFRDQIVNVFTDVTQCITSSGASCSAP